MHDESQSILPKVELSRREFTVATLATGFALAVQPVVQAQVITTSTEGLEAGEVKISTDEGAIPAYRAMPAKGEKFPVVLVVQEIFGVHEHIKDICRRLAKKGYLAIAPEMYARQGDVSQLKEFPEILKIVSKVPDKQVMSDLDATVKWADGTGKADTSKLAITGYCWGGRIVWLYAAHNPKLKAGAAWYGRIKGQADELHPKHPIDVVKDLKAPVIGFYGATDTGIPVADVESMREALEKAKKPNNITLYPDTPHGFYADYRPSYRQKQANEAWEKMLAFFKEQGAA